MIGSNSHISRRQALGWLGGLAVAAGLPPILGACSNGATGGGAASSGTTVASTTQRVAATLRVVTWGSVDENKIRQDYLNAFAKSHPSIQVQFNPIASNYWDALQTQMAGGDAPDLYYLEPAHVVDLQCRGALHDLSPMVSRDKYDLSDFYRGGIDEYTIDGKLWALPRDFANQDIFYNVDLFEKVGVPRPPKSFDAPGWTFDDFLHVCQKLTGGTGPSRTYGFAVPTGFRAYMAFVWSNGGDVVSADAQKCTLNEANAVEGLQFLDDLVGKYQVAPRPADLQSQDATTLFFTGKVGIVINIPANLGQFRKQITHFRWDVAPPPLGPHGTKRMVGGGGAGYGIYGKTKSPDVTWELMKWVTSVEVQKKEVDGGTSMGSRLSVGDYFVKVNQGKEPENVAMFVQASKDYLHTDPHASGWLQAQNILAKELSVVFDGSKSAKEAADAVARQMDPLLRKGCGQ